MNMSQKYNINQHLSIANIKFAFTLRLNMLIGRRIVYSM